MESIVLRLSDSTRFSDDELFDFCTLNKELRIERTQEGNLIIISPSGSRSSNINLKIITQFGVWEDMNSDLGVGFGPDGGFILPNQSMRAPDLAWVSKTKWDALTESQKSKFAPVAPDFIVELKSPTDSLPALKAKMEEWISNGVRLAWLIDPKSQVSFIYKADRSVTKVNGFSSFLDGEDVLPGFRLNLSKLT